MCCKGNKFSGNYTKFACFSKFLKKLNNETCLQRSPAERNFHRPAGRHPLRGAPRRARGGGLRLHDRPAVPFGAGAVRHRADRPGRERQDDADRRDDLPPFHRAGRGPFDLRAGGRGRHRHRRGGIRRIDLHARREIRIRLDDAAGAGRRFGGRQERRERRRLQEHGRDLHAAAVRHLRPRAAAHAARAGVPGRAGRGGQGGDHRRRRSVRAYRADDLRGAAHGYRSVVGRRFGGDPRQGRHRRARRTRVGRPPQAEPRAHAGACHREGL